MAKAKIKIGYAPTRRSIFSAPDAVKYRNLTKDKLKEIGGADSVDIADRNLKGLFYDDRDMAPVLYEVCKYIGVTPGL